MNPNDEDGAPVSRFWTKINLMAEVAAVFRQAPSDKATYNRALEIIQRVVPFRGAALFLISRNKKRVVAVASFGDGFDSAPYNHDDRFQDWLVQQTETVLLGDVAAYRDVSRQRDEAVLVVPLAVESDLIGMAVYTAPKRESFHDRDIKLLTVIGDQIALSVERLISQRELERKNAELSFAQKELKKAQAKLIVDEKLTAVRQLAVSVNHEINNPLSVITGNVEYLLYINKDLDGAIVERLRIIEKEALRIAAINRKLLEIQSLVSETYINHEETIHMLNLDKSSTGRKK